MSNGVNEFRYSDSRADRVKESFKRFCLGMSSFHDDKMLHRTFVFDEDHNIQDSDEKYLAIDFGGTSLKLGLFEVRNGCIVESRKSCRIKIPPAEEIQDIDPIDWAVDQVHMYIGETSSRILAGLTFSYPMKLESIDSAEILHLTKNFHFKRPKKSVDPVKAFNDAFQKKGLNIVLKVIANDTVSTLMAVKKQKKNHRIGIVLGTGTNAAYFREKNGSVPEAVNIERGNFDCPHFKLSESDKLFHSKLVSQNDQTNNLDRMIGGYGFLFHLNTTARDLYDMEKDLTFDDVNAIIKRKNLSNPIYRLIREIKRRSMTIVSALVMGILESENINTDETVTLILNGTIFDQSFDRLMLIDEVHRIKKRSKLKDVSIEFSAPQEASLHGIINILLNNL